MATHDAREVVESLRDHLARHDRPLCFLFGAGTSAAVNVAPPPTPGKAPAYKALIPAVLPLTAICKAAVGALAPKFAAAWEEAEKETGTAPSNIEQILSLVRRKLEAAGPGDKLLGLVKNELGAFEAGIQQTIAKTVNPDDAAIPEKTAHDDFASWVRRTVRTQPVELFTTNYDVLVERALERAQLPVFDGFVGSYRPFFRPDLIERDEYLPAPMFVRLWKIHGSVNWHLTRSAGATRVTRGEPSNSGEMIYPSHRKYDESRQQPYVSLLGRLRSVLERDDALLVTVGYSFSDQHINSVIYGALDNRPRAHAVALQFGDLAPDETLVKDAKGRRNLLVLGRNAAVIGGSWGEWRLREAVDNRTAGFMDLAFDSDASLEKDAVAVTGNFRLGDFNWLSRFLAAMRTADLLPEAAP